MSSLSTAFLALVIYFSHIPYFKPLFVLFNIVIICMAVLEYYRLTEYKNFQPLLILGIGCSAAYVIATYLSIENLRFQYFPFLILLGSMILFFLAFFKNPSNPLANIAVTVFGIVYLTVPLTCILQINYFQSDPNIDHGRLWLTYLLVVTKITDVGAYVIGKTLGKAKLATSISPKKTIEGAIGGLLFSLGASMSFAYLIFPQDAHFPLWQSIWLGLLISLLAQLGDLAESVLKRDVGVKDSSHMPGFGGMLDIVDSLVFTLPLMYLLLQMHIVG